MDMLTNIELELKNALLTIGGTSIFGYDYYNNVTIVNVEDEAVAVEFGQYPTIAVYLSEREPIISQNSGAYNNRPQFKLVCDVALEQTEDIENPRFQINQKMNEMLSDIKAVIHINNTLNCACNEIMIVDSFRTYNTDGDMYRVGQLNVMLSVDYAQSKLNPNLSCPM